MYAPVPPVALTVADPLAPPLQLTLVCAPALATSGLAGWLIVNDLVVWHALLSVTVTVYVPADNPVAVAVVCIGVVFQEYEYVGVPPVGATVAVPLAPPLQETSVLPPPVAALREAAGWLIVNDLVVWQALASVTVTV